MEAFHFTHLHRKKKRTWKGWKVTEETQGHINPKLHKRSPHTQTTTVTSELPHTRPDQWLIKDSGKCSFSLTRTPAPLLRRARELVMGVFCVQLCWMVLDARTGGFVSLLSASVWSSTFAHAQRVYWGNSCQKSRKIVLISSKALFCYLN